MSPLTGALRIVADMQNEARAATCYTGDGWSHMRINGRLYYVACGSRSPKNGLVDWRYGFRYGYVADGTICRDAEDFAIELRKNLP